MGTLTKSVGEGIMADEEDSMERLLLSFLLSFCLKLPTMSWWYIKKTQNQSESH